MRLPFVTARPAIVALLTPLVALPVWAEPGELLTDARAPQVIKAALQYLGTEYAFGAAVSRDDLVDCSSLMVKAFGVVGLTLPRRAFEQSKVGREVPLDRLRRGDRLYFKMTDRPLPIDHTALYLGGGRMLHAFPDKGVTIEPLEDYRAVLVRATR